MKRYLTIFSAWAWPSAAMAAWRPDPSVWRVGDPHSLILLVILAVFAAVCGAMIHALFKHRNGRNRGANHHRSAPIELIWAFVPLLILVGVAWPTATAVLSKNSDAVSVPDSRLAVAAISAGSPYERISLGGHGIRPIEFDNLRK